MAFQGSLNELPLPDIIQLVSVSGKTGVFSLRNGSSAGEIYLNEGQIVHARLGEIEGEEAIYELAIWSEGEFVFTPGQPTDETTIHKSNTNLLMEAARRIDEWQVLSKRIPSTRLVPVFIDQGTRTSVSLTPQEWLLICKIDERRSIEEIAAGADMSPFDACKILYGLITSGLIVLKESLVDVPSRRIQEMTADEVSKLADKIHQVGRNLLAGHQKREALEATLRLAKAELKVGRKVEAVVDLIRSEEKLVSSALGPDQSKIFVARVSDLLAGH